MAVRSCEHNHRVEKDDGLGLSLSYVSFRLIIFV